MLCDVAFFGEVKLPQLCVDDFLTSETREALLPGFRLDAIPSTPRTVEAMLEELRGQLLPSPEHLRVTFEGETLSVKGLVSRETFLSVAPALVSLCCASAPHGGEGTLLMIGLGAATFGYSARAASGRSSVRTLTAAAVKKLRASLAVAGLRDEAPSGFEVLLGEGAGSPFTGSL